MSLGIVPEDVRGDGGNRRHEATLMTSVSLTVMSVAMVLISQLSEDRSRALNKDYEGSADE